jgi:hypothetical protein
LNIELLTISTDNIWKLCRLKLEDILIQQEFIFIEKARTNIPERKKNPLTLNIDRTLLLFVIVCYYEIIIVIILKKKELDGLLVVSFCYWNILEKTLRNTRCSRFRLRILCL